MEVNFSDKQENVMVMNKSPPSSELSTTSHTQADMMYMCSVTRKSNSLCMQNGTREVLALEIQI